MNTARLIAALAFGTVHAAYLVSVGGWAVYGIVVLISLAHTGVDALLKAPGGAS